MVVRISRMEGDPLTTADGNREAEVENLQEQVAEMHRFVLDGLLALEVRHARLSEQYWQAVRYNEELYAGFCVPRPVLRIRSMFGRK